MPHKPTDEGQDAALAFLASYNEDMQRHRAGTYRNAAPQAATQWSKLDKAGLVNFYREKLASFAN
jgi:hypothetical protein